MEESAKANRITMSYRTNGNRFAIQTFSLSRKFGDLVPVDGIDLSIKDWGLYLSVLCFRHFLVQVEDGGMKIDGSYKPLNEYKKGGRMSSCRKNARNERRLTDYV